LIRRNSHNVSNTRGGGIHQITSDEVSPAVKIDKIIPVCDKEIAEYRPRRRGISKIKYTQVCEAENVVNYIIQELADLVGDLVPVSMMFGTMLKEHRNGTGSCVTYDFYDKDFDIVVLPEHFPLIMGIVDDITQKFGWKTLFVNKERLFMIIAPGDQEKAGKGFQIDVYSFHRNKPSPGLIFFPWDEVIVRINDFLPLVKYKSTVVTQDNNNTNNETAMINNNTVVHRNSPLYYHMPFNVPCLLAKMYGDDFMTPKTGKGNEARRNNDINNGKPYYRNSTWCKETTKLSTIQQEEKKNQMSGNWTSKYSSRMI